ncbi:hypothetical protein V8I69_003926 [Salmonella enterica]
MISVSEGILNSHAATKKSAAPEKTEKTTMILPTVTTAGYNGRRGDGTLAAQGWADRRGAVFTQVDQTDGHGGYWLNIVKNAGTTWEIKQPASQSPGDLIRFGGRIFCRFRLKGAVVNNQYAFAFYLRVPESEIPEGVVLANKAAGTNPALAAFCVTTAGNKITLSQHVHGGSPIIAVCDYGKFDNDWHTLELIYPGRNSISIIPVLDGVAKPAVELSYTNALVPEKTIDLMSITGGTVYELDVSSFEGQIYRDDISRVLSEEDDGLHIFVPPSYHTATITIPDRAFPLGFSIRIDADGAAVKVAPENANVLLQPPGSTEGYPTEYTLSRSVTLIQGDIFGKTWMMV